MSTSGKHRMTVQEARDRITVAMGWSTYLPDINRRDTPMTDHPTIEAALAAFQAEMPVVAKDKTATVPTKSGGSYRYTYADLRSITEAVIPLLSKHGLSFSALPGTSDGRAVLRGRLMHVAGEYIEGHLPLFGNTAQEIGSSLTYNRRYLLGCLTGVVTDDDDDGSIAQQVQRTHEAPPEPPAPVGPPIESDTVDAIQDLFESMNLTPDQQMAGIAARAGRSVPLSDLTESEGQRVLLALQRKMQATTAAPTPEEAEARVQRALGGTPVEEGQ